jgi:hypothetical protein
VPYSPLRVTHNFGGTFRPHLQGGRICLRKFSPKSGTWAVLCSRSIVLSILLTGSLWRRQSQQSLNTLTPFNFLFYSLHVSAPTGNPQVIYTISYYFCFSDVPSVSIFSFGCRKAFPALSFYFIDCFLSTQKSVQLSCNQASSQTFTPQQLLKTAAEQMSVSYNKTTN